MTETYYSHSEAWAGELRRTIIEGEPVSPRGMDTLERTFVQFEVRDPMTFPLSVYGREFRDAVGVLEGLSIVGQFNIPEAFTDRVKNFANFTDDGIFWGSYGARLHGQLGDLVRRLEADPSSRQAVLTIFEPRDLAAAKRDIPCTLGMQFLLRNHRFGPDAEDVGPKLDMRVTMRSNDLWLGTPYDLIQFSIVQATVAQALGVSVGRYVHAAGSLHLYERDHAKASDVFFKGAAPMPWPLWPTSSLAGIAERARRLVLWPDTFDPQTEFEAWALSTLE